MTLMNEIENTMLKIRKLNAELYALGSTQADKTIMSDIYAERKELYLQLGRLVANSAVKVCLR